MSARRPDRDRAGAPVRVLVVDDSAVVRQALSAILGGHAGFSVAVAPDPLIALDKIRQERPQVIVLDLEMPRMDGLTFLRRIMSEDPIPVVVCSGLAERGTEAALQALAEGAVEVVGKPRLGVRDFLHESASALVDVVRGAAFARVRPRVAPERKLTADAVLPHRDAPRLTITSDKVVVVGASTGGTEALRRVLEALPLDAPGVVAVQHMPALFTRAFAERLDRSCRIEVKEAASGDRVLEGRALVAPGNRHLLLQRSGAHYTVEVKDGPLVSRHRPSVDVLFRSAAQAAGRNAIGVIMTGMGDDGAAGLLEMKRAGAATVAQDEASCVVFGMPREAVARGAVDAIEPLDRIPEAILRFATSTATAHAAR